MAGEPNTRRFAILCVVLALHLALLAMLLMPSRIPSHGASTDHYIELMVLRPLKPPTVHAGETRPRRVSIDMLIALAPPFLNPSSPSGPSVLPDGQGGAVNWAAEAHRAVRAFEIRRDQFPSGAISVSSLSDGWWPTREHHAGERYKTEGGDWIVWIDANCYQVASWSSGAPALVAAAPLTICPTENGSPNGSPRSAEDVPHRRR